MKTKSRFNAPKTVTFVMGVAIVLVIVWAGVPGMGRTQQPKKSFEKLESYPNDPLKITGIKVANKSVALGEQFEGDDDWLKTTQFTVKSMSEKDIVFIELDLNFPETKASGSEMSFPILLGSRPAVSNTNPAVVLQKNNEATLTLGGKRYERLVQFIEERHPISFVGHVVVNIGFVVFADDSAWSGGSFFRRDPNSPNHYLPN